jgi:mRNA interferase RelE/StbE
VPYHIEYSPKAQRAIRNLDRTMCSRILKKIEALAEDPRGAGSVKLTDHDGYRARVGDFRVLYAIFDDRMVVLIVDVGNRREIYRGL